MDLEEREVVVLGKGRRARRVRFIRETRADIQRYLRAAQEVVANAVQRTADVLSGITSKCRTGQADEACAEEPGAPSAPAAQ